jgi:hypothetical protein
MEREPIQNQTPDLFSPQAGPSPKQAAEAPRRPPRRLALPKDLPRAIRHLADIELDWLLRAAIEEAKRRGRPVPIAEAAPTNRTTAPPATSKHTGPPERQTRQREVGLGSVTQGQMNAVRAAFKAGVPPRRIARQFGLSQTQVRKALSFDKPRR